MKNYYRDLTFIWKNIGRGWSEKVYVGVLEPHLWRIGGMFTFCLYFLYRTTPENLQNLPYTTLKSPQLRDT